MQSFRAVLTGRRLATVGGGEIKIGAAAGWQMVVDYRGKHCPKLSRNRL